MLCEFCSVTPPLFFKSIWKNTVCLILSFGEKAEREEEGEEAGLVPGAGANRERLFCSGRSLPELSKLGRWKRGELWRAELVMVVPDGRSKPVTVREAEPERGTKAREPVRNGSLGRKGLCLHQWGILVFFSWSLKLDALESDKKAQIL